MPDLGLAANSPDPTNVNSPEMELALLIKVMQEASAIAMEYWERGVKAEVKTDFHDIRTEADERVEEFLKSQFSKHYPSYTIMGEETGGMPSQLMIVWDPIDGTNAFERGMEDWCISMARIVGGTPTVGVISMPAKRMPEIYYASLGYGAFLNGKPMKVSDIRDTQTGTINMGQRSIRQDEEGTLRRLTGQFRRLWIPGSTSEVLAKIANGQMEVAAVQDQPIWDIAPGIVLVREAQGYVTQWDGSQDFDITGKPINNILATNGYLHEQVRIQLQR